MRKYATLGYECRLLVELVVVDIDCRVMICSLQHCWAVVAVLPWCCKYCGWCAWLLDLIAFLIDSFCGVVIISIALAIIAVLVLIITIIIIMVHDRQKWTLI